VGVRREGAGAALIFNDGFAGREDPLFITAPQDMPIPAAMISNNIGEALVSQSQAPGGVTGPGINDNGSGSSAGLEIAEQVAELPQKPRNRIRFAFWGAEEAGLVGSTAYVEDLVESGAIEEVEANLNFDLFTGAEGIKSADQAEVYGGTAGAPYDPCYHQACDTIANLNNTALDQMSDAEAHAVWTLAQSKSAVTKAQGATAARAKKSRRIGRTRSLKYQGPFRVR
jgi:Zn-dependent M28 family amino/carboxypeptidase